VIRLEEVAKHTSKEHGGIWVTYGDSVYDITRFIANHPGGKEKILLAAGKDIEPYWNVYRQHFNSPLAKEMLQTLKIGVLHPEDIAKKEKEREKEKKSSQGQGEKDPYASDPSLSPVMRYYQRQPINAEAPGFLLTDSWITPIDLWFVRNHHPVPHSRSHSPTQTEKEREDNENMLKTQSLSVSFASDLLPQSSSSKPLLSISLHDLTTQFPKHSIVSTVQCGGNRRQEMTNLERTNGSNWQISAISTAKWTGVRVRDLLASLGITEESVFPESECEGENGKSIQHLQFISNDGLEASIPIRKALSRFGDVLLAFEMNDSPLPPQHGAPIRVIVPGHVGVRNVKWVKEIRLSSEEAHGTWQRGMAYKVNLFILLSRCFCANCSISVSVCIAIGLRAIG
jgi:sulfite oxidase